MEQGKKTSDRKRIQKKQGNTQVIGDITESELVIVEYTYHKRRNSNHRRIRNYITKPGSTEKYSINIRSSKLQNKNNH